MAGGPSAFDLRPPGPKGLASPAEWPMNLNICFCSHFCVKIGGTLRKAAFFWLPLKPSPKRVPSKTTYPFDHLGVRAKWPWMARLLPSNFPSRVVLHFSEPGASPKSFNLWRLQLLFHSLALHYSVVSLMQTLRYSYDRVFTFFLLSLFGV